METSWVARLREPGYTPAVREIPLLLQELAVVEDKKSIAVIEQALERQRELSLAAAQKQFDAPAKPPLRARLVHLMGRLSALRPSEEPPQRWLLERLTDEDEKSRRSAMQALGKLGSSPLRLELEEALLSCWGRELREESRRSVAESLGKIGGPRALDLLSLELGKLAERPQAPEEGFDPWRAAIEKAHAMALRSARREGASTQALLPLHVSPARPRLLRLRCRRGVERWLCEGLPSRWSPAFRRPGVVEAIWSGPLEQVLSARSWLAFGLPLGEAPLTNGLEHALQQLVSGSALRQALSPWGNGDFRYRIEWADGAHHRALTWQTALRIAREDPGLQNDPTDSDWILFLEQDPNGRFLSAELRPKAFEDTRFAYRVADVPASSHPTLAATLARIGEAREDDVVWDPFVGSALELIERARLGPSLRLLGTDRDDSALQAAARNASSAGVTLSLEKGEALSLRPEQLTLVLTNPPMGRRVSRDEDIPRLCSQFVAHVGSLLVPGGRLVWISPSPERSLQAARKSGLKVTLRQEVDMGGFPAEIQRMERPTSGTPPSRGPTSGESAL